jgi:hypothetical protein
LFDTLSITAPSRFVAFAAVLKTKMSSTPHSVDASDRKEMDNTKQIEVSGDFTWTPEEEKKLVRKIDLFLLPTIWLMYLLSYMDRTKYEINTDSTPRSC